MCSCTVFDGDGLPKCVLHCPGTIEFVCGTDGVPYHNACFLCRAACDNPEIGKACDGDCPCKEPRQTSTIDRETKEEDQDKVKDKVKHRVKDKVKNKGKEEIVTEGVEEKPVRRTVKGKIIKETRQAKEKIEKAESPQTTTVKTPKVTVIKDSGIKRKINNQQRNKRPPPAKPRKRPTANKPHGRRHTEL